MAHALQHLYAWLEREAVAVDRLTRQARERGGVFFIECGSEMRHQRRANAHTYFRRRLWRLSQRAPETLH
jgi:hypothetical protein